MPYNAAERKHVRQAEKSAKLQEAQRREIVNYIMQTPGSRAWMYDRLVRAHIFASSFSLNPYATAFAEGERNMGLQDITDIMSTCPDLYLLMMQEANGRDIAADVNRQRRDNPDGNRGDNVPGAEGGIVFSDHRDDEGNPAFDGYEED